MARIDKKRIAAVALALVDKHGHEGFTIRRVADALGVTPMALYHHVQDKAELALLVVNAAIHKHPLPTPRGNWREDLWIQTRWTREEALAHPAIQELRRIYRVYTPEILQMAERWLSLWQQSGLELEQAVVAARTSSMVIAGLIAEESMFLAIDKPPTIQTAQLPNARLLFQMKKNDPDVMFELAIRSVIDGLYARLSRESATPARPRKSAKPQLREK